MSITIGTHTFDRVHYDAGGDVLYLHKGDALKDADWDETPEGHGLSFDAQGELVGLTLVRPRSTLERHGKLKITLPEHIEVGASTFSQALAAA
jgi:uncharacterized protein YuzE